MSTGDDFSWADVEDDVCVPGQQTVAVYCNPKNNVVIRQEAQFHPDEDHWIVVHPHNALSLARAIIDRAAARQRRRREKQRQGDGVTERDIDRDTVTTAPALPELDLHGGESTALTH
jgi:hypothetical protein